MSFLLIIAGFFLIIVGTAGRRGRHTHDRDWAAEGRTRMRVGDREYWV